jgi:hypothetical protein
MMITPESTKMIRSRIGAPGHKQIEAGSVNARRTNAGVAVAGTASEEFLMFIKKYIQKSFPPMITPCLCF